MADCELPISTIGTVNTCPGNDEKVMFTDSSGMTAMREWTKIKSCLSEGLLQRADLKFIIGDGGALTPGVNTKQYLNPALVNKRFRVLRRGVGTLIEGVEFNILPAGGFELIGADVFAWQEVFHIQEYETIAAATDGGMFTGIFPVSVDTELDSTYANGIVDLSAGALQITLTLPLLSSVNPNTLWGFVADQSNLKQNRITVSGTDTITFRRKNRSELIIGQDEKYLLVAGTTKWIVLSSDTNYPNIGKPEFDYIVRPNKVIAQGQEGSYLDYARVLEFITDNPDVAVSEEAWQADPVLQTGFFSRGDELTWFRFPDLCGATFRTLDKGRGLDIDTPALAKSGRYQGDQVELHDHANGIANMLFPPSIPGSNHGIYATYSPAAPPGNYIRTGPSGLPIQPVGGSETRGKNFAFNGVINV